MDRNQGILLNKKIIISPFQSKLFRKRGMGNMKQANASEREDASECEDGVDMISKLPDHILQMILSRIPTTEEVTRTSILSTRWRYLWTSVPSIDIDCSRGLKFKRNKFRNFVSHVLASSSLDLDSFRLCCSDHYSMLTVYQWIHAAVTRNIKQLHLLFCHEVWFRNIELPYCSSLEILRLCLFGHRLKLPKFTGFPALKVLELNKVELHKGYLVKKFFESCPLLEDVSLIDCQINTLEYFCLSCPELKSLRLDNRNIHFFDESYDVDTQLCGCIKIVCPKLEFFEFGAFVARKYIFKSLGSVKKAVIHRGEFPLVFLDYMFRGLCNLESLSTGIYILLICRCPSDVPVSLPNLKTLELTIDIFFLVISDLITFLTCLPHLESLHLIIKEQSVCRHEWKLDEAETWRILTCHLKRVEFLIFFHQKLMPDSLDLVRSLLEHGNALEEMVFRWKCDEAEFHERSLKTMKKVSKFHKASSTVKLITRNEISY